MTKTLAVILHYNTIEYTDRLYELLKPYERDDYNLVVFNNGSTKGKESKYTTVSSDTNLLFGGGLNIAFKWVLDDEQYDSLLFLNSDIVLHPHNFVKSLRKELFDNDLKIISPCILQPQDAQIFWKTVHCWNSNKTRIVPWVDFQSPLIHRDFIEKVRQYDDDLKYGWGQDVLSGIICEENNWKIGVCDYIPIIHFDSATIKKEMQTDSFMSSYWQNAERYMMEYFRKWNMIRKVEDFRRQASTYTYEI
jgi:GT2 family glycosyltransferase